MSAKSSINVQPDLKDADPLFPPHPTPPHYDASLGAWVLSRYAEVLSAFVDPRLSPLAVKTRSGPVASDVPQQSRVRSETLAALSQSRVSKWQTSVERSANGLIKRLPNDRSVDVLQEFARPWSLDVAVIVTGADPAQADILQHLARQVSAATADPANRLLHSAAKRADAELARRLQGSEIPMSGPAFVALSQTLPCLLANAWLALLRHPAELARLCAEPALMPRAIEELLRFAGLARTLLRQAHASIDIGGVKIPQGARVMLMLCSANRDPAQFVASDQLDLARRSAGHVALGAGPHSCAGGALIRMAAAVGTAAFVRRFGGAVKTRVIEWNGGSGFRSPVSLWVQLRGNLPEVF